MARATFFAARKLSRSGMESDKSTRSTVAHWVWCSVRSISKSSGASRTGNCTLGLANVPARHRQTEVAGGHLAAQRVAQGPFDVQVERVAELVSLGVLGALVAYAGSRDPVPTEAVLGQVLEKVFERSLADAAKPFRRELEPALALLDEAGLLEPLSKPLQLRQRGGGLFAHELPHPIEVDLCQRTGLRGAREHLLELVELAEALEHVGRLGKPKTVGATEGQAPVPLFAREGRPKVAGQTVDLPGKVHVARAARP